MLGDAFAALGVFSAHAEVVPRRRPHVQMVQRILRARGGSSECFIKDDQFIGYSPRTRR